MAERRSRGNGIRRRVKKCEVARAAALSLSPSGGAAVGEALGTTRGHQGSGERTASSQSAAEPARRTVGTRVYAALDPPSVRFVRLRVVSSVRCKASRLPLPCLAVSLLSTSRCISLRDRADAYTVRFTPLFFILAPETTDRLSVRPFVRSLVFHSRRKHRRFSSPGQETTLSDFRWILFCGSFPTEVAVTTTRISSAW